MTGALIIILIQALVAIFAILMIRSSIQSREKIQNEPCPPSICPLCQPELVKAGTCKLPPKGWFCTLESGHQGPCPTWPEHHRK